MRVAAFWSSLVLIFIIPWEGTVDFPGLGTVAKLIGFGVTALWVTSVVLTGRLRKPGPFHFFVFLFVLWNAVSIFWSAGPETTVVRALTVAQLLILTLILWDLYTTRAAILAGLQMYVLGAYVTVGGAIANFFSGQAFYTHYERFSPGDINPDGFGFIVVLGMPVAWYLTIAMGTTPMGRLLKLVNYAYIPTALLGISLSGTRTALIATVPGMVFGLASLTRLRLRARIMIVLLLVVAVLILLPHVQTLSSFQRFSTISTELTEGDLNNRTNNWRQGLAAFAEHPLTGVGSDMYRTVNSWGKVAHNSFLSVLVELGLIGFTLFGITLTIAVIQAVGQPKWDALFWLTLLAVWTIGALTLTWEHRKSTWLFLSLLMASAALTKSDHKRLVHSLTHSGTHSRSS